MLYISLALSGVLFLAAVLAARYAKHPTGTTIGWAAAVALLPSCLMVGLPAVWYQAAILAAGLWVAAACGYSRRALPPVAVGSFLIAYAILGVSIVGEQREYARLRAAYPFESMEDRLPRGVPPSAPGDPARLSQWEWEIERNSWNRQQFLAALHTDTTRRFVDSAGFGVGRMVREIRPTEDTLNPGPRPDAPQPSDYFNPAPGAEPEKGAARPDPLALGKLHDAGFLDFVNPRGFGYVKDRRHVAGFQPHGFTKVPGPAERWEVAQLDLVGLLRHDDPVVYVSARLPRMEELRDAPTRPLDPFEAEALAALRAGADLHVGDGADGGRFLGAVRSTSQCLECHGGDRGALLGAFTYRLRPAR